MGREMDQAVSLNGSPTFRAKVADYLSLERNVSLASAAIFILGLGEELWKKFLPKYLEALGASAPVIGLFGTAEDFFDAIYQYPGGWLADRVGRRRAFLILITAASVGYVVYLFSRSWPFLFLGLALVMAWQSMASPAIFAVIGDSLPRERRAMGFTLQSILKRVPVVIAPVIGGVLIARLGIVKGVHTSLLITLLFAAATILLVRKITLSARATEATNIRKVWQTFHSVLKRLLVSDVIIRTCEGMTGVLTILYVTNVLRYNIAVYGTLVAIQMVTSIIVYIPAGKIADRIGRKPFVIATFASFALFPLAVIFAASFPLLILAFVIGGLREIGEPSRKAMIRRLRAGRIARTISRSLLPREKSVDYTGCGDRRITLETRAGSSLCGCRNYWINRHSCLCSYGRRAVRELGSHVTYAPVVRHH